MMESTIETLSSPSDRFETDEGAELMKGAQDANPYDRQESAPNSASVASARAIPCAIGMAARD